MDSGQFITYQQMASQRRRYEESAKQEKNEAEAKERVAGVVFTIDDVVGELSKPKGERRWGAVEPNGTIYPSYYFQYSALKKSQEIGEPVAYVNSHDKTLHIADATKLSPGSVGHKEYMESAVGLTNFTVEELREALSKPSLAPSTEENAAEALKTPEVKK